LLVSKQENNKLTNTELVALCYVVWPHFTHQNKRTAQNANLITCWPSVECKDTFM
jgi:hypothetical protein